MAVDRSELSKNLGYELPEEIKCSSIEAAHAFYMILNEAKDIIKEEQALNGAELETIDPEKFQIIQKLLTDITISKGVFKSFSYNDFDEIAKARDTMPPNQANIIAMERVIAFVYDNINESVEDTVEASDLVNEEERVIEVLKTLSGRAVHFVNLARQAACNNN